MMVTNKISQSLMKGSFAILRKLYPTHNTVEVKEENLNAIQAILDKSMDLKSAKRYFEILGATGHLLCYAGITVTMLSSLLAILPAALLDDAGANIITRFLSFICFPILLAASSVGLVFLYGLGARGVKNINKRLETEPNTAIFTRTFFNTPNDIGLIFFFLLGLYPGILLALIP